MSKKYTFSILGGDRRQTVVAEHLLSLGHEVRIYGIPDSSVTGAEACFGLKKAVEGSDIVLLPLPASRDGKNLNVGTMRDSNDITLNEIVDCCSQNGNCLILGGMLQHDFCQYASKKGIETVDFYLDESLQKKNALPSAEGAIMVAMQNTDRVFCGMNILICGYGRIGRIIAKKARLLGADVTVAARRDEVLCEVAMDGYTAVRFSEQDTFAEAINSSDVVFNTVPCNVINRSVLRTIKNLPLYIEIASFPGGIDASTARDIGMRVVYAPSLPGKYAPASAGEYIYETIIDLLKIRGYEL